VILGVEKHGSPLTVTPRELLKGRTVTGSFFGGLKPKSDIPLLAQKYLDKVIKLLVACPLNSSIVIIIIIILQN
jgi:S-(hydroxymethyl)glutathione dehydrogenase/alcohol dehydrogenase